MRPTNFLLLLSMLLAAVSCMKGGVAAKKENPVVVVLGIDGADWQLIDPLIREGRLPFFRELKERSAWAYLRTTVPAKSPVIWTSIATGKNEAKHGIDDFRAGTAGKNGRRHLFLSTDIREPTLWDMLTARSRRSVVVNWYLSFPPQPLNGVNVSDYFRMRAFGPRQSKQGFLGDTVYPSSRAGELEKFISSDYARELARMHLPDFPALFKKQVPAGRFTDFLVFREYPEWVLQEGMMARVADHLFRSEKFSLFAAYFKLTDVVQHFAFLALIDDGFKKKMAGAIADGAHAGEIQAEAHARVADILCPVYQNMERIIRGFMSDERYKKAYFIIVSDHGFSFFLRDGTVRYNHVGPEKAPPGILIMRGPGVKPGKIRQAKIFDIAPTVLYLLDLPLDRNMDGIPLVRAFDFRQRIRYGTYERKKPLPVQPGRGMDEKALKELKALGYIN